MERRRTEQSEWRPNNISAQTSNQKGGLHQIKLKRGLTQGDRETDQVFSDRSNQFSLAGEPRDEHGLHTPIGDQPFQLNTIHPRTAHFKHTPSNGEKHEGQTRSARNHRRNRCFQLNLRSASRYFNLTTRKQEKGPWMSSLPLNQSQCHV